MRGGVGSRREVNTGYGAQVMVPDDPIETRAYRLPNGDRLVEVARAASMSLALSDLARFTLSDGTGIEPRTYLLVDPTGKQKAFFGHPREDAQDDYLYILAVYYVSDGALRCGMI